MESLSEEAKAKAKAEIAKASEEETGPDDGGNWPVSKEELSIIRAELACEFPEDFNYLSDAYITSVASKPYSKDMSVRRPLEYSTKKLSEVLKWREQSGAVDLLDLVTLANGADSAPEAKGNPERLARAKALVAALNCGGCYFHGFTKSGKPVMWVRPDRLPWYPDVDALTKCLILLADAGIGCMPKVTTDFVIYADTHSPPPPHPTFLVSLLTNFVRGYPDRMHLLTSAPTSSIMQFVMNLLLPLMPNRLADKVKFTDVEGGKAILKDILLNGEDDMPTFLGGTVDHDTYYPVESSCPNRGQGTLKFDFFGMVERLEQAKDDWEAKHSKE